MTETLMNATVKPARHASAKKMTEVATGLLAYVPFFASLFYDKMEVRWFAGDSEMAQRIPIMGTNGRIIYINEDWFAQAPVPEAAFVLCHEICHAMYQDLGRLATYIKQGHVRGMQLSPTLLNIAQDYRINAMLVDAKIGKMPSIGCYDVNIGKSGEVAEEIYAKLYKKFPPPPKGKGGGKGKGQGQGEGQGQGQPSNGSGGGDDWAEGNAPNPLDTHLPAPKAKSPAEEQANKMEWAQAIKAAKAAAKAVGRMPGNLEQLIDELLDVQIPWQEELRRFMRRQIKGIGTRSYKRLNKRKLVFEPQLILPGRAAFGAENIVLVFDTSGSVSELEFKHMLSEAAAILSDIRPRVLWSIQGDADVADVKRFPEGTGVRALMYRKGFGGTDFRPPFERVAKLGIKPDCLVYFTDLMGPFPDKAPSYPVIWCTVNDLKAPWGRTIRVKT